jgi:hypothetical protein
VAEHQDAGDHLCREKADRLQIEAMRDIERLEDLTERLVIVSSWDELMA